MFHSSATVICCLFLLCITLGVGSERNVKAIKKSGRLVFMKVSGKYIPIFVHDLSSTTKRNVGTPQKKRGYYYPKPVTTAPPPPLAEFPPDEKFQETINQYPEGTEPEREAVIPTRPAAVGLESYHDNSPVSITPEPFPPAGVSDEPLFEPSDDVSCTSTKNCLYGNTIPGIEGIDYPIFAKVPSTNFKCSSTSGYYGDPEARCQSFHVCLRTFKRVRRYSFLCPNGTIFSQKDFVCVWWHDFDCDRTRSLYSLNKQLRWDEPGMTLGKKMENLRKMSKLNDRRMNALNFPQQLLPALSIRLPTSQESFGILNPASGLIVSRVDDASRDDGEIGASYKISRVANSKTESSLRASHSEAYEEKNTARGLYIRRRPFQKVPNVKEQEPIDEPVATPSLVQVEPKNAYLPPRTTPSPTYLPAPELKSTQPPPMYLPPVGEVSEDTDLPAENESGELPTEVRPDIDFVTSTIKPISIPRPAPKTPKPKLSYLPPRIVVSKPRNEGGRIKFSSSLGFSDPSFTYLSHSKKSFDGATLLLPRKPLKQSPVVTLQKNLLQNGAVPNSGYGPPLKPVTYSFPSVAPIQVSRRTSTPQPKPVSFPLVKPQSYLLPIASPEASKTQFGRFKEPQAESKPTASPFARIQEDLVRQTKALQRQIAQFKELQEEQTKKLQALIQAQFKKLPQTKSKTLPQPSKSSFLKPVLVEQGYKKSRAQSQVQTSPNILPESTLNSIIESLLLQSMQAKDKNQISLQSSVKLLPAQRLQSQSRWQPLKQVSSRAEHRPRPAQSSKYQIQAQPSPQPTSKVRPAQYHQQRIPLQPSPEPTFRKNQAQIQLSPQPTFRAAPSPNPQSHLNSLLRPLLGGTTFEAVKSIEIEPSQDIQSLKRPETPILRKPQERPAPIYRTTLQAVKQPAKTLPSFHSNNGIVGDWRPYNHQSSNQIQTVLRTAHAPSSHVPVSHQNRREPRVNFGHQRYSIPASFSNQVRQVLIPETMEAPEVIKARNIFSKTFVDPHPDPQIAQSITKSRHVRPPIKIHTISPPNGYKPSSSRKLPRFWRRPTSRPRQIVRVPKVYKQRRPTHPPRRQNLFRLPSFYA